MSLPTYSLFPLAFASVSFAANCLAQPDNEPLYEKVLPGDESIQVERIRPHAVEYNKFRGAMLYEMTEATLDGSPVYALEIYMNAEKTGTPDKIYIDRETLGYAGRLLELKDYTIDVRVNDGHFTGTLIPATGSDYQQVNYDKHYEHGGFEPAVINYFIAALPLAEGYKASLPIFDLNNGSRLYWANIEVLGKDTVKHGGKEYTAWKVLSQGIREKTIWVSDELPYALKMQTKGNFGTWQAQP